MGVEEHPVLHKYPGVLSDGCSALNRSHAYKGQSNTFSEIRKDGNNDLIKKLFGPTSLKN